MTHALFGAVQNLTEETLSSDQVLQGHFLQVWRDRVRLPSGQAALREYIAHPGAVVVVAQLADGRILMERQYRYPLHRVMVELPAGKLDASEDPLLCARRELREETGYSATQWAYAGGMHNAIAYSNEIIHMFFARGLTAGPQKLDEGEFLEVFALTLDELLLAAAQGQITDAKTLTALLWVQNVHAGRWTLDWQEV
jgi:ADP-ribose pyrophosphatase